MLAFIHKILYDLVVETNGLQKWNQIREEAGLSHTDTEEFCDSDNHGKVYEDEIIWKIVKIASRILDTSEDDLLDAFGVKFVNVSFSDHRKTLTSLGCSLHSLLNNLDHMHQVFKEAKKFDGMKAPSFTCEPADSEGYTLIVHYYSVRRGLEKFVCGALRQCAKVIYNITVVVDVFKEHNPETGCVSFKIQSSGVSLISQVSNQEYQIQRTKSKNVSDLPISMEKFCKAFPFHIIFNRNFEIIQMGSALVRVLGSSLVNNNKRLSDYFTLVRPEIEWNFSSIQAQCNSSFLLHLNSSISEKIKRVINLTGQMIHMPESKCILYVGSPVVENLDHLRKQGLYISDIPIHDATRDLILVSEQSKAQGGLKKRLQSLKAKVQETSAELEHEKKKTEDLLEAIFPKEIAKQLIHKKPVDAQTIESVTMLFSDLVGFTGICGKCAPMDVVNMLSKLYTKFDTRCTELELYKVETIGDAYVVAGGLDTSMTDHAYRIALMALSMMESAAQVVSPENVPLRMRIGIHTGSVVAGVVGVKMPRYCLFGNNVTLANKMESGSEAGKINISPETYKYLNSRREFSFEVRDQSVLPEAYPRLGGDETCYFLTRKASSGGKSKMMVKVTVTEESVPQNHCTDVEESEKNEKEIAKNYNEVKITTADKITTAESPTKAKGNSHWQPRPNAVKNS